MKKLPILLIAGLFGVTSCKNTFLDLAPLSSPSTATFYKTQTDFVNALNAAYGTLQSGGLSTNFYIFGEIPSDNTSPVLSGSVTDGDEFDKFYIRTTNPYLLGMWNDSYRGIYRCNAILDRIGGISMNEALKTRLIGEAKFLRAYLYFNLVRIFGDVPLVVTEITDPAQGYEYGRAPVAEVYAQLTKDLTEAEQALPVSYAAADLGRATKGAARSLLGKVYLTRKLYPEAAAKLREVIDAGTYSLLPNYADVFLATNKNHKESIFDIQFKEGLLPREGSGFGNLFAPVTSGNAVIQFSGDGTNMPTADIDKAYEAGDVRKNLSMATSYINAQGVKVDYPYVKKFLDQPAQARDSDDNWPVIRYADVLLMYAEALTETGKVAEALPYLNQIRTRAKLAPLAITSQADMRLALERERRVELAFEGHRWFDLVRTGRALAVLKEKAASIGIAATTTLTENNLLWPIPQSQIDINPTKIKQNPGY